MKGSLVCALFLGAVLLVSGAPADAHCVACVYVPDNGCWACGLYGGFYHQCIIGPDCALWTFPTYSACANYGNCLADGSLGDVSLTFGQTLLKDLAGAHPEASAVLAWVNEHGGLQHDSLTVNLTDRSAVHGNQPITYTLSVRTEDGRPSVVELEAVNPTPEEPPMGKLLFRLAGEEVAESSEVLRSFSEL